MCVLKLDVLYYMYVRVGMQAENCATFVWQRREGGKIENDHDWCDGAMVL